MMPQVTFGVSVLPAERNVMLLPVGRSDDGAHSQNEKLDLSNYINGIKLLGSYVHELAKALAAAKKE